MIADVLPPSVLDVPVADGVNANVAAFWRSGAMQNDSGEFTLGHVFNRLNWTFYTLCAFDFTLCSMRPLHIGLDNVLLTALIGLVLML